MEIVRSEMPILAKREAFLDMTSFECPFATVSNHGSFGLLAKAHCSYNNGKRYVQPGTIKHDYRDAPHPDCSCGFYAVPIDKANFYEYPLAVTLLVELSGKVIEHELGFRAEWQRVIECQIPPCIFCGRASEGLQITSDRTAGLFSCTKHSSPLPGEIYISPDDLAHRFGIPVTQLSY